jgi:MoxR-like ATPase
MPRTQSALLEAMAERQITVDGESRPLPDPFLILATENPLDHEGTFPLPEAQLDRFFLKTNLGYPSVEDELRIVQAQRHGHPLGSESSSRNEANRASSRSCGFARPSRSVRPKCISNGWSRHGSSWRRSS